MPGGPYAAVDHVQVVMPGASGLLRDITVNTFTFQAGADLTDADYVDIDSALGAFYNATATGADHPICNYLGAAISRSEDVRTKHYRVEGHLNGTAAGSPDFVGNLGHLGATLGGTTAAFPNEVAVALAFHGPFTGTPEFGGGTPPTRPRSRLRGRIYLGPLIINAATWGVESVTNRVIVGTMMKTDFLAAGKALFNALQGLSPAVNWVVWSRKNADIAEISTLTVDDAFDTQRRRGQAPTVRAAVSVP
jgi:hypothetical protein